MLSKKINSVINAFRSFLKGGAKNKKTSETQVNKYSDEEIVAMIFNTGIKITKSGEIFQA